jgi:hypothetical protein
MGAGGSFGLETNHFAPRCRSSCDPTRIAPMIALDLLWLRFGQIVRRAGPWLRRLVFLGGHWRRLDF